MDSPLNKYYADRIHRDISSYLKQTDHFCQQPITFAMDVSCSSPAARIVIDCCATVARGLLGDVAFRGTV
jgi:hypothetical protein